MTVVDDPLANPVWHALGGPQSAFAEWKERVRRFRPDVSVFAGLPDDPDADDWDALRSLVGPGGEALIIRAPISIPPAWEKTFRLPGVQMVLDGAIAEVDVPEHTTLGEGDVAEMTDLVERTEPGPWRPRTIDLGTYLGVRVDGALVAMAGERMRPPGYTEISAVCTDPAFRGRGLAAGLTRAIAERIATRRERPMLHAASENAPAVRLYESLGFRRTRDVRAVRVRAPE